MPPLTATALARRLRSLDPSERAAFVADLWAARGYDTAVDGTVVVAGRAIDDSSDRIACGTPTDTEEVDVAIGLDDSAIGFQTDDVVVLEAGPRFSFESRLERMEKALRPDHSPLDVWEMGGKRDEYVSTGAIDYPLNEKRVKGVGGTTLHWLGITPRMHEKDFEMASRYDLAADWPIEYADLEPYYDTAESELGVAGQEGGPHAPPRSTDYPMDAFPDSYVDSIYKRAADELGISVRSVPQARNSRPRDGRSQCIGYSTCIPVCPSGAKYSGDVHVRKAEEAGARVLDRVPVQSLEHDAEGEAVEAAVYVTPDGTEHRQPARSFVLAAGAVEIPRLLLLSRSDRYPDGLANSSGLVGKYFIDHPIVHTIAELPEPTNQEPIGFPTSGSLEFYEHETATPGSFMLRFGNAVDAEPVTHALRGGDVGTRGDLLDPLVGDRWGDELIETEAESPPRNHRVNLGASIEQLPRERNRVSLDPSTTDDHGNPVPKVSFEVGEHAVATIRRALDVHERIIHELDGTTLSTSYPHNPPLSGHHLGTTRMGTDPGESVVDRHCRTHDLENLYVASGSVFVTAGAVQPTLTIAALALRTADVIDDVL